MKTFLHPTTSPGDMGETMERKETIFGFFTFWETLAHPLITLAPLLADFPFSGKGLEVWRTKSAV